jgi:integrase
MSGKGRGGDGISYVGVVNGRRQYRVRLLATHPKSGEKVLDTKRLVFADSKIEAARERDRLTQEALQKRAVTHGLPERKRFAEVADEWYATLDCPGTMTSWGSHLRRLKEHFGKWWMDELTDDDVTRFLANVRGVRKEALGAGTINSMRDVLVKIGAHAKSKAYVKVNVAAQTERVSTRKTRAEVMQGLELPPKRSLDAHEVQPYLRKVRTMEPDLFPLVCSQFLLGCRFAEVSALRRTEVNWETGFTPISRGQVRGHEGPTKGKYARPAAFGEAGLAMLREHLARMDELKWPGYETLLFPRPKSNKRRHSNHWSISSAGQKIRAILIELGYGVASVTHLARHTMNNVTRQQVDAEGEKMLRRLLGHSTVAVNQSYSRAEQAEVIDFAAKVEAAFISGRKVAQTRKAQK